MKPNISCANTRSTARPRFRRDIKDLNSFMDEASFPSSLRMKLREYFRYQTQTYSVDRYRHLLNRLSPALRREVANQRDNSWIERVRLFQKCPEDFRIAIAMIITQTTFPPAEVVVREGELNEHMHIIRRGVVASGRRILMTGEVFGEEMLYHRSLPADCSSWTVTCVLFATVCLSQPFQWTDIPVNVRARKYSGTATSTRLAVSSSRTFCTIFRACVRRFGGSQTASCSAPRYWRTAPRCALLSRG